MRQRSGVKDPSKFRQEVGRGKDSDWAMMARGRTVLLLGTNTGVAVLAWCLSPSQMWGTCGEGVHAAEGKRSRQFHGCVGRGRARRHNPTQRRFILGLNIRVKPIEGLPKGNH